MKMNYLRNLNQNKDKKILALIICIILTFSVFISPAKAATDEWATITPTVPNGTAFNTVTSYDNYIYLGTSNGVYRSSDSGSTWSNYLSASCSSSACNVTSIAIGWTYDGSSYITDSSSIVLVGTSNGGIFKSTIGNPTWTQVNTGLTDTIINDIEIDQFLAVQGTILNVYAATPSGVFRSDDAGDSWALKNSGLEGVQTTKLSSDLGGALIYTLTNTNKLYSSALFSSSAVDENWALAYDGSALETTLYEINSSAGTINWLATDSGILKSLDAGATWEFKNQGLGGSIIKNVIGDYTDTNIAYAALLNIGVYKTVNEANGSPQWLPINKSLTDLNIKEVKTDPKNSTTVYAVGENGLYQLLLSAADADLTAPSAISDLSASSNTATSILLNWTSTGDDLNYSGSQVSYDIRYSTSPITNNNWASATEATGEPNSLSQGEAKSFVVQDLTPNTVYYFAIKAIDDVGNQSTLSTNSPDTTAPVITLVGNNPATVEKGAVYTDAGATALDNLDGNITANIITTNLVTTTETGTFTVRYNVTDASGNAATEVTRTVNVVDTTAPVLTEITKVTTPTTDNTPDYTFSSSEAGTINYSGGCSSASTIATSSNNTITFNTLTDAAYSACKITVTDASGNVSSELNITSFTVNTTVIVVTPPSSGSGGGGGGGGGGGSTPPPTVTPPPVTPTTSLKLVKSSTDNKIYLIENGKKRLIPNDAVFASYNYKLSDVKTITADELNKYTNDSNLPYASGTLVKIATSSQIYIIKDGKKSLIPNETIFASYNYSSNKIIEISPVELSNYANGTEIKLAENSLIMSDFGPRIYLTRGNKRYWVKTDEEFKAYGLKRENVLKVDVALVRSYEDAGEINILAGNQTVVLGSEFKLAFSYGKPRLGSLTEEQKKAIELRQKLEKNYSKKQLTGINGKNWNTITNSYIYGGYPVEAIVKTIKYGGKTVHPSIPYEKWKNTKDYIEYIKK